MNFNINFPLIIVLFTPCIYSQVDNEEKFPVLPTGKSKIAPDVRNEMNDKSALVDAELKTYDITKENLELCQPCGNITTCIDNKLEKIKNDLINEMTKKHTERTRFSEAKWEHLKQDITKIVTAEFKSARRAIDKLAKELDSINSRLQNVTTENGNCGNKLEEVQERKKKPKPQLPKNCKEILEKGTAQSGIYFIKPTAAPRAFKVFCDMETRDGGWIYFMKRFDGSQNFYLNWTAYKKGFGKLKGEFWLGLEHLYELTGSEPIELLLELTDWEGKTVYADFEIFSIGNESERYAIKVLDGYSGNAGRAFLAHINRTFSTLDKQDDDYGYCVEKHHGPWWYGPGCFVVKFTGEYLQPGEGEYASGIHYNGFHDYRYSLKEVKMMVRP